MMIHQTKKILLLCCLPISLLIGQQKDGNILPLSKQDNDPQPSFSVLNINNFSYTIRSNALSRERRRGSSAHFPRQAASVIYSDGIVWGGYTSDPDSNKPTLRVGGATFGSSLQPGWIITPGDSTNPPVTSGRENPRARIYRIRKDWQGLSEDDPTLRLDVALINRIQPENVTSSMIQNTIAQYAKDWQEWPGDLGAPYYDRNSNGVWDSGTDEPGLQNADQVIWFVCNDMDSTYLPQYLSIFGSPPLGLEVQTTLWAYDRDGPLGDTVFRRTRLYNYSGFAIDSMFIGHFSDPDIGTLTNDLQGCDTLLQMAFAYNRFASDYDYRIFNLPPSSVGFTLLQGPTIDAPGNTAIVNFKEVADKQNQSMNAAIYFPQTIGDPALGDYYETKVFYARMNGFIYPGDSNFSPEPYITRSGPETGLPTRFPLSGDPISRSGDLDGAAGNGSRSDVRVLISSGLFTLLSGEMQEVVFAIVGGNSGSGDNLTSFKKMRQNVSVIRSLYGTEILTPNISNSVVMEPTGEYQITSSLDFSGANIVQAVHLEFAPETGTEAAFMMTLSDDGSFPDSIAGDNIWTGTVTSEARQFPYGGNMLVETSGDVLQIPSVFTGMQLRPSPQIEYWRIVWENSRQDSIIASRERTQIAFDIINQDNLNEIRSFEISPPLHLHRYSISLLNERTSVNQHPIAPSGRSSSDAQSISIVAPANGDSIKVGFQLLFDQHSAFYKQTFPVFEWPRDSLWRKLITVTSSTNGDTNLVRPYISDASIVTGDSYEIQMSEQDNSLFWTLINTETGETHLSNQTVREVVDGTYFESYTFGEFPIVDGIEWQVLGYKPAISGFGGGSGIREIRYAGEERDSQVWIQRNSNGSYSLSTLGGTDIQKLEQFIELAAPNDFELRFTNNSENFAIYGFEDQKVCSTPFELWDIGIDTPDDPTDDVRMIPWVRSNDSTRSVWGWATDNVNSPVDRRSDAIYFFHPADRSFGSSGYDAFVAACLSAGGPGALYTGNVLIDPEQITADTIRYPLGELVFRDRVESATPPPSGTTIRITTIKPYRDGDRFQIQAPEQVKLLSYIPEAIVLNQNYPNPYNASTNIYFELNARLDVRLEVYNILGQRVSTLLNKPMDGGRYTINWNGSDNKNRRVASGVYFYRLQAGGIVKTKRMVLLK